LYKAQRRELAQGGNQRAVNWKRIALECIPDFRAWFTRKVHQSLGERDLGRTVNTWRSSNMV
jgi:peroxiredoxin